MPISRFDYEIQKAMQSVAKNDFTKAKMQLGAMETKIKRGMKHSSNGFSGLADIKRIRLIRAGLFNKKIRL